MKTVKSIKPTTKLFSQQLKKAMQEESEKTKSFKEEFPELKNITCYDNNSGFCRGHILRHCKSNKRIKEAIEKAERRIVPGDGYDRRDSNGWNERKTFILRELGL